MTVTVSAPPFSVTESGLAVSVIPEGAASSSSMVKLAAVTVRPETAVVAETETASPLPSSIASWVGSILKVAVPVIEPAAMVSVTSATVA